LKRRSITGLVNVQRLIVNRNALSERLRPTVAFSPGRDLLPPEVVTQYLLERIEEQVEFKQSECESQTS